MGEFINLDELEQESSILTSKSLSASLSSKNIKVEKPSTDEEELLGVDSDCGIISIDKIGSVLIEEEGEEHICIKDDCDVSKYYGCTDQNNGFLKDNLFSELTDEYQRTIARINLGIAEEYALKWGNITGNVYNQKDLYKFVTDLIAIDINKVIDDINLKLLEWSNWICIQLKNKADIYSPNFLGEPTTTLPSLDDNSNRIASTAWVTAKLLAANVNNIIEYIKVTPEYKYVDDPPINVKVVWRYKQPIIYQTINDEVLDINVTLYTFENVNEEFSIILRYYIEGGLASSVINFQIKTPIYYGTSTNYLDNLKTIYNKFLVTANEGEYIYIMLPNIDNPEISVNGLVGGFVSLGYIDLYNTMYYIYKSVNPNLGTTNVKIETLLDTLLETRLLNIEKQILLINSKNLIALE